MNILKRKSSIVLIIIGILIIVFIFVQFKKEIIEKVAPALIETGIEVYVNDNKLVEDGENFIITDMLIPTIGIRNKRLGNLIHVSLDQSSNILEDKLSQIKVEQSKDGILIHIPYALSPEKHNIEIIVGVNGNKIVHNFSFILLIKDNFSLSLEKSKLWAIPKSTKENHKKSWYVENSLLKIDSLSIGPHASLAFLYTFNNNVTIDFQLNSLSNVVNLVVYFLESGKSIVIGNGNNYTTWILYDEKEAKKGEDFLIEPNNKYKVRIIRDSFTYKLFIKEVNSKEIGEVVDVFSSVKPALTFVERDPSREDNHIGFTLWGGGGGVEISNVIITGHAIY